jgi:hypothetical protein
MIDYSPTAGSDESLPTAAAAHPPHSGWGKHSGVSRGPCGEIARTAIHFTLGHSSSKENGIRRGSVPLPPIRPVSSPHHQSNCHIHDHHYRENYKNQLHGPRLAKSWAKLVVLNRPSRSKKPPILLAGIPGLSTSWCLRTWGSVGISYIRRLGCTLIGCAKLSLYKAKEKRNNFSRRGRLKALWASIAANAFAAALPLSVCAIPPSAWRLPCWRFAV